MFKEKVKALIEQNSKNSTKKKIENIFVFILILIVTVIAINTIWNGDKVNKDSTSENSTKELAISSEEEVSNTNSDSDNSMEKNLENILSNIDGVGKVKVLITYSESSEVVAMYNENNQNSIVEEKDSNGGTRTTTQNDTKKDIVYKEENGEKIPVTRKSNKTQNGGCYCNSNRSRKCEYKE